MAASAQDVYRAIESLTPAELLRIREFAVWRIKGLGRKNDGRNHEDLMQEAVVRTVSGDRRWNQETVSIVGHLLGAMRSISNHWATQFTGDEPVSFSELDAATANGRAQLLDRVASTAPMPDTVLAVRQEIEAIERLFVDDPAAARILDCVRRGLSGPETQAAIGASRTEYETIMRRIRRRVRTLASRGASR